MNSFKGNINRLYGICGLMIPKERGWRVEGDGKFEGKWMRKKIMEGLTEVNVYMYEKYEKKRRKE